MERHILLLIFINFILIVFGQNQQKGDENCETLPSEIHLIKGKTIKHPHPLN